MSLPQNVATATHGTVAQAAASVFPKGNAIDAVVAGVFAAAAVMPTVLFGPVQLLLGGTGAGLRAIDGRTRQPGLDQPRPRGFMAPDEVPSASRVAVPTLVGALATALVSGGSFTLSQAVAPALDIAKALSSERHAFLKRVGQRGPSLLTDARVAEAIVASAGRMSGGLISLADLEAARPDARACRVTTVGTRRVATVPWGGDAVRDAEAPFTEARAQGLVAAADAHGLVAIACFEAPLDGLPLDELGIVAPFTAAPVMRGEPRVKPGVPRPAAAPIAIGESGGLVDLAIGVAGAADAESHLRTLLGHAARLPTLDEAIHAPRTAREGEGDVAAPFAADAGLALGVIRSRTSARLLADRRNTEAPRD